ncbi:MAG: hypothetical protein O8C66_15860 [Candidatus Methanoperedens sp.]|nr:hypothetical protein [Candidatus Methanoperedens sp.]MCZ7371973.1 hypothetical protein [Candidatus Methanoperedens sp.]
MMVLNASLLKFKLDIERIGHIIDLDEFKIKEASEQGKSTLISSKFFNKGVYRVRNTKNGRLETIAVNIDKIAAVTYEGLKKELGEGCVDKLLWKDVPEGEPIFFYSLKLENDFVK